MTSIFIQLQKRSYLPGEQVNGFVQLQSFNMESSSDKIKIKLEGVERVSFTYEARERDYNTWGNNHNHNHYRTVIRQANSRNTVISQDSVIYQFPDRCIPPGQFSFPFSFVLPSGCPSTFLYEWNENNHECYADLKYNITAYAPHTGSDAIVYQDTTNIIVSHPPQAEHGSQKVQKSQTITCCCCCSKGDIELASYFEKNSYHPGETAYIISEIDNGDSSVDVSTLEGSFRQEMILTAEGHTKTIINKIGVIKLPGIPAHEKRLGQNAIRCEIKLVDEQSKRPVQPTCIASLIKNTYQLEMLATMDTTICCDEHPSSRHLVVVSNMPTMPVQPTYPPNWNPQQMPHTVVEFFGNAAAKLVGINRNNQMAPLYYGGNAGPNGYQKM